MAAAAGESTLPSKTSPGIALTVNGEAFTQVDVDKIVSQALGARMAQIPPAQRSQVLASYRPRAEDQLISRTLLSQAAKKAKIEIDTAEVDKVVNQVKGNLPAGQTLEAFLSQRGTTEAGMREDVASGLQIRALLDQKTTDVKKPDTAAVKAFYDGNQEQFKQDARVKARHILVPKEKDGKPVAGGREKAEAIRKKLVEAEGKNFAELALAESSCPSKAKGGSLGFFGKGQMVPPFEKAAYAQEVGEVGAVVETRFGYHIIQVEEKEEAKTFPFQEVEGRLGEQLYGQEKQKVVDAYLKELRAAAVIKRPGRDAATPTIEPGKK